MEDEKQYSGYKGIFKSTLLFGFVQIFKVIIGVVKNKIVAIILGAEGMGVMGIYNSTISLIQTGAGLGVSQSAVRDIAQANQINDTARFSRTIIVTNKVIYFTSLLGCIITVFLSPWLSEWTMGDRSYTWAFILISMAVGFHILSEGQLAILKGMRQLKALAKASMIGSVVGIITAVPLFYFFGKKGIVPSLIITAFSALFFSNFYGKKIKYIKLNLSLSEVFQEANPMIRMGISLMFVTFLSSVTALIISAYIRHKGGFAEVGFYVAGTVILSRYFGVIITALSTDYYPRIAAINQNNNLLQDELNKQSSVSLVLLCPLIVIFLFMLSYLVPLLYSNEFIPTGDFLKFAIWGTLITIISNQVDMILVAKFQIKIFTIIAVGIRIFQVIINIVLYNLLGLIGVGISLTLMGMIHMLIMTTVVYRLYKIRFTNSFLKFATIVFLFSVCAVLSNELIHNTIIKSGVGVILSLASIVFSIDVSKKHFDIDFIKLAANKLKSKNS
jgi:O-antigen/teichoic acid export membrane protein